MTSFTSGWRSVEVTLCRPGLLASQFAALEEPERGVVVDIGHPPETIVALIREQLAV